MLSTRPPKAGDSEHRLSQERVKYAMLGGSKVVVGTSIASNDLLRIMAIRRRAPGTHRTITPLYDSPHDLSQSDSELRLSKERVSSTRCLAALKWWLESASPFMT